MAYDIALTQQEQIGQMHGWLTQWGLPLTGINPAMAWMAHGDTAHDHTASGGAPRPAGKTKPGMTTPATTTAPHTPEAQGPARRRV
jgi:uncharacterized protein (DUF305 family)